MVLDKTKTAMGARTLRKYVEQPLIDKKSIVKRLDAVAELKDNLELSSAASGIDSLVQYFYDHTVSFLDYFTEKDSLIILDEPARVAEKGEAVTAEYRESMMGRLEKGYVLPGQMNILYSGEQVAATLEKNAVVTLATMETKYGYFRTENMWILQPATLPPITTALNPW